MDTTAPVATGVEQLATNPRNIVVQSLDVTFSEPIDLSTFTLEDVRAQDAFFGAGHCLHQIGLRSAGVWGTGREVACR